MYLAIIISMILIVTFFIALITKKKFEIALPLAFALIIILGYILGLCGLLKYLTALFTVIAVGCLIAGIILFIKNGNKKEIIFQKFITPGFVVFVVLLIVTYLNTRGRMLAGWDEFSHWGLVVKNMFALDSFGNAPEATTFFKDYPPGMSILQYFFTRFNPVFVESYLFLASILFSYAVMLPVCKNIEWKQWKYIPLFCLLLYAIPLIFFPVFHQTIYVDTILGLVFAYILYMYFTSKELDTVLIIQLSALSVVLCIIKEAGVGMALLAWLIIMADYFVNFRKMIKLTKKIYNYMIFIPLICIFISKFSWDIYLNAINVTKIWDTSGITLAKIIDLFGPNIQAYQLTIITNFINGLLGPLDYIIRLPYFLWCIALFIAAKLIANRCHDEKLGKRINLAGKLTCVGFFVYSTYLLLLYLFTYTQYEAQSLASYARYLNTYMIGFLVFIFSIGQDALFSSSPSQPPKKLGFKVLVMTAIIMVFVPLWKIPASTILVGSEIKSTQQLRANYDGILKYTDKMDKTTDKVYLIAQNTNGFDYWVLRYNATPIKVNETLTWSLGEPYAPEDVWTRKTSLEEWEQELKSEYTYVYLHNIDERFIKDFGDLFADGVPIQNGFMYYIDKSGDDIKLYPVDLNKG